MKRRLLVGMVSILTGLGIICASLPAAALFNQNRLIDDGIFSNAVSMNASQIDTFLNGFPNSCISTNSGFAARIPSGYSPSAGFTFGDFTSAGQVIATSAGVYGINPQVLLVTLQKEQSLVTGGTNFCSNNGENMYAAAMGYGCPDGGSVYSWSGVSLYRRNGVEHTNTGSTCVNSAVKAGFSQQVIRAAWLLKFGQQRSTGNINWAVISGNWDNSDDPQTCYGGPVTQGYRQVCPSGPTSFYDGYRTVDSTAVHMDTGGTAALYWYTPHFHGNQNFISLFEGWFGSTVSVKLTGHPGSVSWGFGRLDVFIRGSDGSLWQKYYDTNAGGWGGGFAPLNVAINSSPSATSWGSGRLDIFYVDTNGDLGHYWYGNGAWQNTESLGRPGANIAIADSPGAVSWGSGRIDIFTRGTDNALWVKTYDGSNGGWQAWQKIGGTIISAPSVSSWSANRLDVFATGPAGDLEHFWYDADGWHLAESLGKPTTNTALTYSPGASSWGTSRLDIFGRGSDGVLWQKWFDATGWHPWVRFSGVLNSAPNMSTWAPQRLDEFSTGPAGDLQHYWFNGYWGNWESFGQPVY